MQRFFLSDRTSYLRNSVLAVLSIFILCLFNYWLFRILFHTSYFAWFVDTGPLIGLVTAVIGIAWQDLDEHRGLIASNPYEYLGAYAQVAGLAIMVLAPVFDTKKHVKLTSLLNFMIALLFALLFLVTIFGWLILVIPLQYFVFLICGALPRMALNSSTRVAVWLRGTQLGWFEGTPAQIQENFRQGLPEDLWVASLADKPFKLTGAFSVAFLFLLEKILNYLGVLIP